VKLSKTRTIEIRNDGEYFDLPRRVRNLFVFRYVKRNVRTTMIIRTGRHTPSASVRTINIFTKTSETNAAELVSIGRFRFGIFVFWLERWRRPRPNHLFYIGRTFRARRVIFGRQKP